MVHTLLRIAKYWPFTGTGLKCLAYDIRLGADFSHVRYFNLYVKSMHVTKECAHKTYARSAKYTTKNAQQGE